MDLEDLREHLLGMQGSVESLPFDDETLVYKVGNRMFAIIPLERQPAQVNLKCDPERAAELREQYPDAILPGYHMDKTHWNTVHSEEIPHALLVELCQHSWDLIVAGLTRKARAAVLESR
jgi:predicted DNA-binding protein (MmcQ/YjbR family)